MLEHQICGDTSRMGVNRHVTRYVGRRGRKEVKEMHGGRMKR